MTKYLTRLFALLICIFTSIQLIAQEDTAGFPVITPENVTDLELGYALPDVCDGYDPTGDYIQTFAGTYEIATGERVAPNGMFSPDVSTLVFRGGNIYDFPSGDLRFSTNGYNTTLSPDGRYVHAMQDGVYDANTGERLYDLPQFIRFSSTGAYIYVDEKGVYETSTGDAVIPDPVNAQSSYWYYSFSPDDRYFINELELTIFDLDNREYILDIEPSEPTTSTAFSPDSSYVAIGDKGVYSLLDGEQVLASDGSRTNFSPDGTLIAFDGDAVYEVGTWREVITLEQGNGSPRFTADNQYLHIFSWGAYHTPTGNFFAIDDRGSSTNLSPNGDLLIDTDNGIYDLATFDKLVTFDFEVTSFPGLRVIPFNTSQTILARSYDNRTYSQGVYSVCLVYGVEGADWAYRSGLVTAENAIPVYNAPNGEEITEMSDMLVVFSQTEDGAWYRVSVDGAVDLDLEPAPLWVRADDVIPISMPEGIPIEDPNA